MAIQYFQIYPENLKRSIRSFNKNSLRKVPPFERRKIPYCYETLPVTQLIEDLILFVHGWQQKEQTLSTKVQINNLKRKLAVLEQEHYLQAKGIY